MSGIKIIAAACILVSAIALFVSDETKLIVGPLIVGNVFALFDSWRSRRE